MHNHCACHIHRTVVDVFYKKLFVEEEKIKESKEEAVEKQKVFDEKWRSQKLVNVLIIFRTSCF